MEINAIRIKKATVEVLEAKKFYDLAYENIASKFCLTKSTDLIKITYEIVGITLK
jgi:hypothetical protein